MRFNREQTEQRMLQMSPRGDMTWNIRRMGHPGHPSTSWASSGNVLVCNWSTGSGWRVRKEPSVCAAPAPLPAQLSWWSTPVPRHNAQFLPFIPSSGCSLQPGWLLGAPRSHAPMKMKVFISPTSFGCAGLLLPLGSKVTLEPQRWLNTGLLFAALV